MAIKGEVKEDAQTAVIVPAFIELASLFTNDSVVKWCDERYKTPVK